MLKFVLLVSAVTTIASASYGHGGGYGGSFYGHSVPAAVISKHHVKHYDVHTPKHYIHPTTIDVPANYLPVNFVFRSASSPIHVAQKHESAKGSYQATHSYDEPHKLVHTVYKPIHQEVQEIISPHRRIVQKVEPVKEEIQTIVARGNGGGFAGAGIGGGFAGAGMGGGMGGGYGGNDGGYNSGYGGDMGGAHYGGGDMGGYSKGY